MAPSGQRPLKVGLYLPAFDQPWAGSPVPRWADVLTVAKLAEEVGFDSLWVPDHLLLRFPEEGTLGVWEGWSLLAALAAVTQRAELGALVACSAFRSPTLLAKMADTVDEISGGRLVLGLGAGWHEPEFDAFGLPFDHRVSRLEEALQIVCPLLRDGRIDFAGSYYQARDCELRPRGPRLNGPPIMVGVRDGERVLRLAARHANACNRDFAAFDPDGLAAWQARVDGACAAVGRDPATLARTAAVFVDLPSAPRREGWGALAGPPEELSAGLRAYARLGFSHVQLWLEPGTRQGIEAFAGVLELLDQG